MISTKNFILGMLLAGGMFWLLKKAKDNGGPKPYQPEVTQANISIVLDAYTSALNDGASQSDLNDLNEQTASEYGLRAYQRSSDGKVIITDMLGKEVKAA